MAITKRIYPASYYGAAWPADVFLCVASLKMHDQLFVSAYSHVIEEWLKGVKKNLDKNGLIPHAADPLDSKPVENARGSSLSLMLLFLYELDQKFADEQFAIYREKFVGHKFGLTGVREYPKGDCGTEDIDSGPVILQFGAAATIVGMQTLSTYHQYQSSTQIRNALEAVSFPTEDNDEKKYLFGAIPIADAFIAWGHSAMPIEDVSPGFSSFRIYSIIGFILLATFFWILVKTNNPDEKKTLKVLW